MNYIKKAITICKKSDSRGLSINRVKCSGLSFRRVNFPAICTVDQSLDLKTLYEAIAIVQTIPEEVMVFL